jgi:hypothetical protein
LEGAQSLFAQSNSVFGHSLPHVAVRHELNAPGLFLAWGVPAAKATASKGTLGKGVSKAAIKAVEAAFPHSGFHDTLLRLAKDYGGSTLVGGAKVTMGIVKW